MDKLADDWEIVVGLEIHAQVASQSKLFSGASTAFGNDPNSQVSLIDAALPGTLPVLNEACVRQAIRTGLGLGAQINRVSVFERKHYFYPDLPPGYQISQYQTPIVGPGSLLIYLNTGESKTIGITRLHLEQDAGKSEHDGHNGKTCIDLNRAGIALMEIVTEPDMRSGIEAAAFVRTIRSLLRYLGTCGGNMEQGELRADVNVSVRRFGEPLGTRCEIKNLNSISSVKEAADSEARRQIELLEAGDAVRQETRSFDPVMKRTHTLRVKEGVEDYRFFPDPDLLPLRLSDALINLIARELPELPNARIRRFVDRGLPQVEASLLCNDRDLADYFETLARGRNVRDVARWMCGDFLWALNRSGDTASTFSFSVARAGELLDLIASGQISTRMAKNVLESSLASGKSPAAIVTSSGSYQESDAAVLHKHIGTILTSHPELVREYRDGNDRLFGFFMGEIMRLTHGAANPRIARDALSAMLREAR